MVKYYLLFLIKMEFFYLFKLKGKVYNNGYIIFIY